MAALCPLGSHRGGQPTSSTRTGPGGHRCQRTPWVSPGQRSVDEKTVGGTHHCEQSQCPETLQAVRPHGPGESGCNYGHQKDGAPGHSLGQFQRPLHKDHSWGLKAAEADSLPGPEGSSLSAACWQRWSFAASEEACSLPEPGVMGHPQGPLSCRHTTASSASVFQ